MSSSKQPASVIRYAGGKDHSGDRIAILVSRWNPEITDSLFRGAEETLLAAGVLPSGIIRSPVPGSFELPSTANIILKRSIDLYRNGQFPPPIYDAVICLGCVIRGETSHFDYICQSVAQGIKDVSLKYNIPVIFGVLTVDNPEQAQARAGGEKGNKGNEAALAALEMIDLVRS